MPATKNETWVTDVDGNTDEITFAAPDRPEGWGQLLYWTEEEVTVQVTNPNPPPATLPQQVMRKVVKTWFIDPTTMAAIVADYGLE